MVGLGLSYRHCNWQRDEADLELEATAELQVALLIH
jgi:hypothetical protein